MKRLILLLLLCMGCVLTSCSKEEETTITGTRLYYLDREETQLVAESYTPQATTTEELVKEYIVALNKKPQNSEYKLAKPENINIIGYNFGSNGQLQLSFDDNYTSVTGISEVLMRAAIVKTFTQIKDIQYVEFYINGQPLILNKDTVVNRMEASDFIDNVGEMISYKQSALISVYFANDTGDALLESFRQVEYDGSILLEQVIVEQLIEGPTQVEVGMQKTIPKGTTLNKISKKDGICTVDLSNEFLTGETSVSEEVMIYSIVNTLVEQPGIDKVQFLIDSEVLPMYKTIPLDQPFERNLNVIESEK